LQKTGEGASPKSLRSHAPFLAGALTFLTALWPSLTETAVANGETRTIYLYHTHTHEQIAATYLVNGQYDRSVLQQLNWFLRDWRRDEPTNMDPRLFDVVWEAYRHAGASEPIQVVSAYRSPETNAMLRRRSRAVAKYSQHMLGKAMDTTLPGMPMERIREIGMRMQRGGVGYYPTAGTPFVHLDVGSVRSWPRMTYEQLVRLFPDGKTVHLPANGQPLARYEEAKAEIEANGGGVYAPPERKSRSFLAFLFGGGKEDDEDSGEAAPAPSARKQWASLAPRDSRGAKTVSDEEGAASPGSSARGSAEALSRAESNLPRGETELTAGSASASATPLPPSRPGGATMASREAESAQGEDAAANDGEAAAAQSSAPLPPRRPSNLSSLAAAAPVPPPRPVGDLVARTADPSRRKSDLSAANALAKLVDVTGSTPTGFAAASAGSEISPSDASQSDAAQPRRSAGADAVDVSASEATLAYAALAASRDASQATRSEAPTGLRAAARSGSAKLSLPARADLVPARLDRSNFREMIGAAPASRIAAASVLGSSISAPRSAARAEPNVLTIALQANYVSRFATQSQDLPTSQFAPAHQ
jgi:uncharacterized protein YcbK (DUF882 family)